MIKAGLSLMPTNDFAKASLPLFGAEQIDTLEWSFDMSWRTGQMPDWCEEILTCFSEAGELTGHGVFYSPCSIRWTPYHERWLQSLSFEVRKHHYTRISEHFGFARAKSYDSMAPLPVPYCTGAIERIREHMQRLHNASGVPVGMEVLALAFGPDDVFQQGAFIEQVVGPKGFIVLDLHNIYCQMENFLLSMEQILATYPVELVKQIHVSGGSWSASKYHSRPIRRDTHDDQIPETVFDLIPQALEICPNVDTVILERLGGTMQSIEEVEQFHNDYSRLKEITDGFNAPRDISQRSSTNRRIPEPLIADVAVVEYYEDRLTALLAGDFLAPEVIEVLKQDSKLTALHPYIEHMQPRMIEVAQELIRKWGEPESIAR